MLRNAGDDYAPSDKRRLKNLARPCAPGLTPRAILEKFATLQMLDVHLPTTDGRYLILPRHTQPQREHQLLLDQLKLRLPEQPTPKILARIDGHTACQSVPCSADLRLWTTMNQ